MRWQEYPFINPAQLCMDNLPNKIQQDIHSLALSPKDPAAAGSSPLKCFTFGRRLTVEKLKGSD